MKLILAKLEIHSVVTISCLQYVCMYACHLYKDDQSLDSSPLERLSSSTNRQMVVFGPLAGGLSWGVNEEEVDRSEVTICKL